MKSLNGSGVCAETIATDPTNINIGITQVSRTDFILSYGFLPAVAVSIVKLDGGKLF
jgi:hypothetical protein